MTDNTTTPSQKESPLDAQTAHAPGSEKESDTRKLKKIFSAIGHPGTPAAPERRSIKLKINSDAPAAQSQPKT